MRHLLTYLLTHFTYLRAHVLTYLLGFAGVACAHLSHAEYFLACIRHEPRVDPVLLLDKVALTYSY